MASLALFYQKIEAWFPLPIKNQPPHFLFTVGVPIVYGVGNLSRVFFDACGSLLVGG